MEQIRQPSPEVEDAALRSAAGLVDRSTRDLLRVTGADRLSFLQGMLTQDVSNLAEGRAAYAALCTAKGSMVSDAWVLRLPGFVLLALEPGMGPKVKAALEKFLISEDAELEVADLAQLDVWGPRAGEVLRQALGVEAPPAGEVREAKSGWVAGAALGPLRGLELYAPRGELSSLREQLSSAGAQPVSFDALEVARVEAGVPRFGQDMDEETIPLEANLERAISYSKGCYLGQEVIARVTYRGHVNQKLCALSLGQNALPRGTPLFAGGKQVGQLTSVARSIAHAEFLGLGMIHRDFTEPDTRLEAAGGIAVRVRRA